MPDIDINECLKSIFSIKNLYKYGISFAKFGFLLASPSYASAAANTLVLSGEALNLMSEYRKVYQSSLFDAHLKMYFEDTFKTYAEKEKFIKSLASKGTGFLEDNIVRILSCIEKVDSQRKTELLGRTTRKLLIKEGNVDDFFRVCNIIEHTLAEDLWYMSVHINDKRMPYSFQVQGLLNNGLVYLSLTNRDEGNRYDFTPLANLVYECMSDSVIENIIDTNVATRLEIPEASDDEIKAIFKK